MSEKKTNNDELLRTLKAKFGASDSESESDGAEVTESLEDDDVKAQLSETLSKYSGIRTEGELSKQDGDEEKASDLPSTESEESEESENKPEIKIRKPRVERVANHTPTQNDTAGSKYDLSDEQLSISDSDVSGISEEISDFDIGMDLVDFDGPKEDIPEKTDDKSAKVKKKDSFVEELIRDISRVPGMNDPHNIFDADVSNTENDDDEFAADLAEKNNALKYAVPVPALDELALNGGFVANDTNIANLSRIPCEEGKRKPAKKINIATSKLKRVPHKKSESLPCETLDEDDVALAIKFGYEYELAENIGYDNLKKHKNSKSSDKNDKERAKAFGYIGREYSAVSDREEIRQSLQRAGRNLKIKTVFTAVFILILFAIENAGLFAGTSQALERIISNPLVINYVAFALMALIGIISIRPLFHGFIDAMKFNASAYSAAGFTVLFALIYDAVSITILSLGGKQYAMFNTAAGITVLLTLIARSLDYKRECCAFETVSLDGKKYTVEEYAPIVKNNAEKDRKDQSADEALKSAKVDITGDYFERSSEISEWYKKFNFVLSPIFGMATVVMLVSYIKSRDLMLSYTYLVATVISCMPVSMVLYNSVTFFIASRNLKKHKAAIIGEGAAYEYSGATGLVFGERFMVDARFVSLEKEHPEDEMDMQRIRGTISRLIQELDSPVSDALRETLGDYDGKNFDFHIEAVESDGIEVSVNSTHHIHLGERDYMVRHKIRPKQAQVTVNNEEVAKKNTSTLYVSVDEIICWKIAIDYKLKLDFISTVKVLSAEGMSIGVETVNPNINGSFIIRNRIPASVRLLIPDRFGLSGKSENTDVVSADSDGDIVKLDSGIVAEREVDLVYPVIWCRRICSNLTLGKFIACVTIPATAAILTVLAGVGITGIPASLMLTLLCIVTNIPSMLCGLFMKKVVSRNIRKNETDNKKN